MPDAELWSPGAATSGRASAERRLRRDVDRGMAEFLDGVQAAAIESLGAVSLVAAGRHRAEPFRIGSVRDLWDRLTEKVVGATRRLLGLDSTSTLAEDYLAGVTDRLRNHPLPDDVFDSVQAVLDQAVESGWSERVIHSELIEALDLDSSLTYRTGDREHPLDRKGFSFIEYALRLARTEATAAYNVRQLTAADMSREMAGKQWVAYMDRRTRRTHAHANGQIVPISATFQVGFAQMQYPGDPAGGASETANCRCTLVAVRSVDLP